ncbi:hypothetical protein [Mucilaginibacter sp. OK098]|uniref:hypothetical protein n=1 Tax=Mucilaginibacter sp. OK098 TaxID=1855297 RepID=UPI000933E950|nr:hypothetical protein [Mucilaginibacter sp. OK098]
MEKQTQCPECKSYKIESFKSGAIKFGFGCIISALFFYYFFSAHLIITISFFILGALCIFNGFKNNKDHTCKACNYKFKI